MKKLLAGEKSKETESKKRSPNVIARLMGLDGLPTQQPARKQKKRSLENCQHRTISVDKDHRTIPADNVPRNGTSYDRQSSGKSSKEQQEFKDVFEVLEIGMVEGSNYPSQRTAKLKISEAEMAFIQQKFMDAKRLSTDENLHDSKEFQDALELLDSNKDLLLKFLHRPDSLFTTHIHDLQGAPPQSYCEQIAAVNSSKAPKSDNGNLGRKSEREVPRKNSSISSQKHHNGLSSHLYNRNIAPSSLKSSKIRLEGKEESAVLPTRIVVLKPNLAKTQTGTNTVSLPCSSHDYLSDCRLTEHLSIKYRAAESWEKKNFSDGLGRSRHKSRESREIAKEITRKMRSSFSSSMNVSSSGFRGYAGDESSSNVSGNESANESEASAVTSRNSFEWNYRFRSSLSPSTESSISREAKKRLSERWKMTHKSQVVQMVSRGSTLGEMLAIPDREIRTANSDTMIGVERFNEKFASSDEASRWVEPLGISSRDGWKDGCLRSLSRSRSLPSSATFGSPKSSMRREILCNEGFVNQAGKREKNKAVKGKFDQRKKDLTRNVRSSNKKFVPSHHTDKEGNGSSPEILLGQNKVKINLEENHPSEQDLMVSEMSDTTATKTDLVSESVLDVRNEEMNVCSEPLGELLPEFSACVLVEGNSSADDLDNLPKEPSRAVSQEGSVPLDHPASQLESPKVSSKETDQPSPVSVLEAPFTDDLSSGSECFESLSADLQGLRMQLQLLKLESEAYIEGPILISSDEESGEVSVLSEEKPMCRAYGSRWSSYVADVLAYSGFNNADDPDVFVETWHSQECPVNPLVFEELEKKYCHLTSWSRSERRLLFDHIISGILEIYQQFTDPHPWVKPMTRRVAVPKWSKDELEGGLCKLLASREMKVNKDAADNVLSRESEWLDLGDDVDVIGGEMEMWLMDELVAEAVAM